jgi:hypothetical protein
MRNIIDSEGYIGLVVSDIRTGQGLGTSSTRGTSAGARGPSASRSNTCGIRNWIIAVVMHDYLYSRLPPLKLIARILRLAIQINQLIFRLGLAD